MKACRIRPGAGKSADLRTAISAKGSEFRRISGALGRRVRGTMPPLRPWPDAAGGDVDSLKRKAVASVTRPGSTVTTCRAASAPGHGGRRPAPGTASPNPDMRPVRRQSVLHHHQPQMRMLAPQLRQQTLRRVPLAVVLLPPIRLHNRLRRHHRQHLPTLRMHQHRAQRLMVVRRRPVLVALLAAVRAMHLRRRKMPRAVHRQQVPTPQPLEPRQRTAALRPRKQPLERPAQLPRVHHVQTLAQPHVRRRPLNPEQAAQVLPPRLVRRLPQSPRVLLELQQRRILQREYRQPRHQTVRQVQPTPRHLVLDRLEAAPHLRQQARHRQRLAELRFASHSWSPIGGIAPIMASNPLKVCEKLSFHAPQTPCTRSFTS